MLPAELHSSWAACSVLLPYIRCYTDICSMHTPHQLRHTGLFHDKWLLLQTSALYRLVFINRQHLSYDVCLEVRGKIIRTVLPCIVYWSCAVISTFRWAVLTVLWIGFCHTGPISLCVDLFVFICVYFVCFCFIDVVLLWAWWGGPGGIEV